ncbi:MAG: molybdopterin-dependent oxidoreductase [Candidatus Caldarchaeum sp.]
MTEYRLKRRNVLSLLSVSPAVAVGVGLSARSKNSWFPVMYQPVAEKASTNVEWKYTTCIICGQGCPIKVKVLNGNVLHTVVHAFQPGLESYYAACGRPRALADVWNHPDRIRRPMIRVGERGSGNFRAVTWEEALDYAASNLKKYINNPEQVVVFSHQGCEKAIIDNFAYLFGTPNVTDHRDTCHTSSDAGRWFLFGSLIGPSGIYHDYERAQFIVLVARNPYGGVVATPWTKVFSLGVSRGARVVVLDVRYSDVCEVAEKYYIVKPGTDLAVMLAIAREIINLKAYDAAHLNRFTNAAMLFDPKTLQPAAVQKKDDRLDFLVYDTATKEYKFRSEAANPALEYEGEYEGREVASALSILKKTLESYTPEWAEKISNVPADEIRWIVRNLVTYAPRAFIDNGYKTTTFHNSPMLWRMVAMINVMIGSWGARGGIAWPRTLRVAEPFKASPKKVQSIIDYWRENGYPLASTRGYSMLAIRSILEEKPYPIKAAIVFLQNLASHLPDSETVIRALKKLEFVMVFDTMWCETCTYADLILPVPFFFETDNASLLPVSKSHIGQVSIMTKVVDPPKDVDARNAAWIVYKLTERLMPYKLKELEPLLRVEEIWKTQAKEAGIDYDMLRKYGTVARFTSPDFSPLTTRGRLPTSTGFIELINLRALEMFKDFLGKPHAFNPLPAWVPPKWMQTSLAEDEFIPIDYMHNLTAINTWARDTKLLVDVVKWDRKDSVFINAERARRLGIKDGATVEVFNPVTNSSLRVKVRLSNKIDEHIIAGIHGLTPGIHEKGLVKFTYMPKHGINTNYVGPFELVDICASSAFFDFKVKVRKVVA